MATTSYRRHEWNDDERKNDYIPYHSDDYFEYIPVYKILKEMYDEDKAALYCYNAEDEFNYKYCECLYDDMYLYSDYYDTYSETSNSTVETDVEEDNASEGEETDQDVNQNVNQNVKQVSETTNDADHEKTDETEISCQSKFIYL